MQNNYFSTFQSYFLIQIPFSCFPTHLLSGRNPDKRGTSSTCLAFARCAFPPPLRQHLQQRCTSTVLSKHSKESPGWKGKTNKNPCRSCKVQKEVLLRNWSFLCDHWWVKNCLPCKVLKGNCKQGENWTSENCSERPLMNLNAALPSPWLAKQFSQDLALRHQSVRRQAQETEATAHSPRPNPELALAWPQHSCHCPKKVLMSSCCCSITSLISDKWTLTLVKLCLKLMLFL